MSTKIIYRMRTWLSIALALLSALTIVLLPWYYQILYQEKEIMINMNEKEYLINRDRYAAFKVQWRYASKSGWRRARYIYGIASKLPYENRETKMYHQRQKGLAFKDGK